MILIVIFLDIVDILDPFAECMTFFFCGCLLGRFITSGIPLRNLLSNYALLSLFALVIVGGGYFYLSGTNVHTRNLLIDVVLIAICSTLILLFILVFRGITSTWWIKFIKNLGNMTYSMYMVHFPIQLAIYFLLRPEDDSIFNQPATLLIFVAISLIAGWLTFHYFEKPVQKYLRVKFSGSPHEAVVEGGKEAHAKITGGVEQEH